MAEDTRKNILEVDTVQSIDKTDTVLVNDSGSLKQVSVETLVSSGIPDQYVTDSELNGKGYATTTAMNSGLNGKIDKNQGSGNSGKYLSVGLDGNVTLVDAPSSGDGSGMPGKDGITPTIGENGNWYLGETDTGKPSRGEKGDAGDGVPSGGTTGQVLTKNSDSDGDASWEDPSAVSDEQVKTALRGYFEENPVSGMTEEQEQQLSTNTQNITDLKKIFNGMISTPYRLNRGLIASDGKIYYKAESEENYTSYNLFLFDVSDSSNISMSIESSNNIIRVALSNKPMNELISDITELFLGDQLVPDNMIYNGTIAHYDLETLDVSTAKTMMVYVGTDVTELDYMFKNVTLNGVTVYPENTTFIHTVSGAAFESYEYTENNPDDILAYDNAKQKLYAYKNTSAIPTFAISFPVDTEHAYKITASGITRCRIGLFDTYNLTYGSTIENSTNAYATIAYDDTKTDIDIEFIPEINGLVVAYLSNTSSDVDVTVQSSGIDLYALDSKVKVGNENIPDNTIKKEKLAFDISSGLATSGRIPLLSNILTSKTETIDTIFEFDSAPNDWVTDSTGMVLDVSTEDFYNMFYNKWVGNHADGFTVTRTQLGMDQSAQYPIYEYDFCPQNYTYTVLLSSGMHTYELSAHFGLAWFMKTYMRQVDGESLSDGFEYLRKHVRIKVIPISNPWGWNQSPKKYGNRNGVNINRNFDYETDNGGSAWEQFPVQTDEWNQKGSAPFSEAEAKILRDWALANPGAYFWIDCHTGLGLGPWDNFIYYSSNGKYVDKIVKGLSTLENRIKTKYSKQNPTKEVRIDHEGSIRLVWGEKVAGIPGMTIEQTPNNTLWGTSLNNESGDITEFAVTVYCYLFSVLPYNIDAETWIQSIIQPITSF